MHKIFTGLIFLLFAYSTQALSSENEDKNDRLNTTKVLLPEKGEEKEILITNTPKNLFIPITAPDKMMYSTIRIETDKGVCTSFRFNFDIGNPSENMRVPCLVTSKHAIKGTSNATLIFHKADKSGDNMVPSKDNFRVYITQFEQNWIIHPDPAIELCAMPLVPLLEKINRENNTIIFMTSLDQKSIPSQEVIEKLSAVEEVLMVGYPTGFYDCSNNLPIFRKGITSSHPAIDFNGKPEFMIDAACFPGSSGSPVFLYNNGTYLSGNTIVVGQRIFFLGILDSGPEIELEGRITIKNLPSMPTLSNLLLHLGYVIKSNQLEGIRQQLEKIVS